MKKKYSVFDKGTLKCVLVGDTSVGKSWVAARLASRQLKQEYIPTLFDNYAATVQLDGRPYHVSLFDTAGQEDFDRLRVLAYMNCDVFLVCFSVDNLTSLHNVEECWVPELRHHLPNTPFILVGTQTDRRQNHIHGQVVNNTFVHAKQATEVATRVGATCYVECSALTNDGMEELTREIISTACQGPLGSDCTRTSCCACKIV